MTTSLSSRRWLLRLLLGVGLAALAALALAVILIAIPVTRRLAIVALAEWMLGGRLESLAVDLDIQPNLRWIFALLVILPVSFGLGRMVIAREFTSAARGLALAAGTLLALGVLAWWQTRHFNFDAKGRPVVYLSFRRDGVHKSYSPGIDRVSGRPKYEVTLHRVLWLSELARQPVREVDPAVETNWFDANSGEPNLWYVQTGTNQWQFFNRPHFHQQLRVEVSPITPEVMACWQAEHDRKAAAAEALRRLREAEAKAAAEKKEREERERAEQRRQADLKIRTEAEARARQEAERREREEQLAREEQKRRAAEAAAEKAARVAVDKPREQTTPQGPTTFWSNSSQAPYQPPAQPPAIPMAPWTAQPVDTYSGWANERILEPVGNIVVMPFQVVGCIFRGLAGSSGARSVHVVRFPAGVPPPGAVVWSPTVRPPGSYGPPRRVIWNAGNHIPPPGIPPGAVNVRYVQRHR